MSFNVTKAKKFIDGYSSIRKLTEEEKKSLKILCQGAAIRFLLTRVFDYLNLTEGAIVKIKDPVEYLKRLEFHDNVKNYQGLFFLIMEIKIYTDGACVGNPGPGGWAAIILLENEKKELFGGEKLTTNNRMELTAAIKALEYCAEQEGKQPSLKQIKIYTDSTYVKEGITVWINNWEKNNWKTADKKNVKNVDLWKKLKELVKSNQIEWNWIKGHSEDPMNDLADKLAKEATPI